MYRSTTPKRGQKLIGAGGLVYVCLPHCASCIRRSPVTVKAGPALMAFDLNLNTAMCGGLIIVKGALATHAAPLALSPVESISSPLTLIPLLFRGNFTKIRNTSEVLDGHNIPGSLFLAKTPLPCSAPCLVHGNRAYGNGNTKLGKLWPFKFLLAFRF